jgi:hypothetical protein
VSRRLLHAIFEHEGDVLAATRTVREFGYEIVDVYSPYAIHGIDKAMGLRPSRLTWACFLSGLTGLTIAVLLQYWTSAVDWPLDVGGKPWNSWPAFVPVSFELTVLLAGFGSVFALFAVARLYPGKKPALVHDRVTNDRFVLVLVESSADFDAGAVRALLAPHGLLEIQEHLEPATPEALR